MMQQKDIVRAIYNIRSKLDTLLEEIDLCEHCTGPDDDKNLAMNTCEACDMRVCQDHTGAIGEDGDLCHKCCVQMAVEAGRNAGSTQPEIEKE